MPWAYIDGKNQGEPFVGGTSGILNFLNSHFIKLMEQVGRVPTTKQIASSKNDISLGCRKKSSKTSFDE